jgi:hypothetical protein
MSPRSKTEVEVRFYAHVAPFLPPANEVSVGGSTPKGVGGSDVLRGQEPPPALRATSPNVAPLLREET